MSHFRQFSSLIILIKNNGIAAALSLFVTISLANFLGPENFGVYSHILIIAAFISIVVNFGMDQTAPVFYSRVRDLNVIFNVTYLIRIFLSIFCLIVLTIVYWKKFEFQIYVACLMLANLNLSFFYEIQRRNEKYSYIYLLERIIYVVTLIVLFKINFIGLPQVFSVFIIAAFISLNYQFFDNRKYIFKKIETTKIYLLPCFRNNFPIVVVALSAYVYGGFSRIILENQLGNEQLGIYSAGWQIIIIGTIFQAQVTRLLRFKFSEAVEYKKIDYLRDLIRSYLIFSTAPMLIASILISIFSDVIVSFIFTTAYDDLSNILPILGFYFLVINFASLVDILWIALRKNSFYMYINLLCTLFLLTFLFIFSTDMDMKKFALSVVIAHLLTAIILAVIWFNLFKKGLVIV